MHCYIDLMYTNWIVRSTVNPTHIPISPRITPHTDAPAFKSVKIMWAAPLNGLKCGPQQKHARSTYCTAENRVVQYAISASSSEPFQMAGFWGPEQTTGNNSESYYNSKSL
ncbi:unnamed protein product [Gongylonema pulchrum]|uniref:Fibronectin type-III domain-containing protein n=1 Tax=Gongylonema pulchrum TaxID=637853 RepID=A0A183DFT1_9BILA|nr:unnamed protein product [Gongylonema pulchrum]